MEGKMLVILRGLTALLIVLMWSYGVCADEVADQIKEALELYEKGNYSEAVTNLNFAVGQIQQKQAAGLKVVFPEPLVEDSDRSVDIEIVTDSPLLQSVLMFFTNPAFTASQPDTKLVKIGGQKALQKFNSQDREGEINIVIASRMLVSIKGRGSDKPDDMLAYANAMDFGKLSKFLEK
jgi:hypothetical protein